MKFKFEIVFIMLIILRYFDCHLSDASELDSISVQNNIHQSTVTVFCNAVPVYMIFALHQPERIVIDFLQISKIKENIFPILFDGNNLIKRIRISTPIHYHSVRIVCDLHYQSNIQSIAQKKIGKNYSIILTLSKQVLIKSNVFEDNSYSIEALNEKTYVNLSQKDQYVKKQAIKKRNHLNQNKNFVTVQSPIVVAIDAGHGGYDPGATGYRGIYEKDITFSIATKLKKLLESDSMFRAVMIRDGDYFLSVMDRSDLARKRGANILISIHADSSVNSKVRGASVWVLSNRRAQSEMMNWLQCKEKHSELLGGLGDVLANYPSDPYFNHVVLDLQFVYAQREGYNIAVQMLDQLKNVSFLHKHAPEYSNFGVLKSPDITSVLVETGFISNIQESYLLINNKYQEKIAQALYRGIKAYFSMHYEKQL